MKERLMKECPFGGAWEHLSEDARHPIAEMGCIRADYDGSRWWNTCWRVHKDMECELLMAELDTMYRKFVKEFPTLPKLKAWCKRHEGKRAEQIGDREYNTYYISRYGAYWFRIILRSGDYNLYLHCYNRQELKREGVL